MRRELLRRTSFVAAATAFAILAISPAHAKPSSASVDAVFLKARCASSPCESGRDPALSPGSIIGGVIQIDISAHSGLAGLDRIRLEAKTPSQIDRKLCECEYICLDQWFGDRQINFSKTFEWDTRNWPKPTKDWGCPEATPHVHGESVINGAYAFRVRAWDVGDDPETDSTDFSIKIANAPAAPNWSESPSASDGAVSLKWAPNRERDIAEYHFVRVDPAGHASEFAVDATKPAAQGCSKVSTIYYTCRDSSFDSSGTYRYSLVALRAGPGATGRCSLSGEPCLESALSEARSVSVEVAAASAPATASEAPPSTGGGARASVAPSTFAAPSAVGSEEAARHEALLGGHGKASRGPIAAGAAGVAVAVALALFVLRRKVGGLGAPKE